MCRAVSCCLILSKRHDEHLLSSWSFFLYFCDYFWISLFLSVCLCLPFSGVVVRVVATGHQSGVDGGAKDTSLIHRWSCVDIICTHAFGWEKTYKATILDCDNLLSLFLNVKFDVSLLCHLQSYIFHCWFIVDSMLIHRWSIVDPSLIHRWSILDPLLIQCWSIFDPSLI